MFEQYDALAACYDRLQSAVDHNKWADYLVGLNRIHSLSSDGDKAAGDGEDGRPLLLDLGCGTGKLSFALEDHGFDIIGIDRSMQMLQIARDTARQRGSRALFLQQDISRFELYGTVDFAVCALDTVNHLLRKDQIRRFFKLCANYLNQNSLLIIDLATHRHFAETLGQGVFFQDLPLASDLPAITMLWQNYWFPTRNLSQSEIILFAETEAGSYQRSDETISERYYDWQQIRDWAGAAGLQFLGRYGELSFKLPRRHDERIFMVFRQPAAKRKFSALKGQE
jgi:SAM-dependent methyltransferase